MMGCNLLVTVPLAVLVTINRISSPLFVLVRSPLGPAWVVPIALTPSACLAELELTDRRVLAVVETRLAALEVLQIDLGHFHIAVAHEPREAVELAPALQPRSGEGVAELVRR